MLIRIIFSLDLESQLGVIVYISNMNSLFVRFLWVGVPYLWILGLHAQGNLQFNQVKLVQAIDSVPQNKVWKLESAVLGISQGIRVSPTFYMNGDTVVLGYDSYNVSRWENVTSVVVQVRGQLCGLIVRMRFLGSGGGAALDQDNSSANLNNTYNQFTTVATFTPPSPGNNEIDRWNFWLTPGGSNSGGANIEFRIVVNLANGAQIVDAYSGTGGGCGCCYSPGNNYYNYVGSPPSTTTAISRMDRTRPQISTSLPMWLPAGTTLQAGGNVKALSVIEFNVLP
jgi:hypothetical protein